MIENAFSVLYEIVKCEPDFLGLGTRPYLSNAHGLEYITNSGATYAAASSISSVDLVSKILTDHENRNEQFTKLRKTLYNHRRMELLLSVIAEHTKTDVSELFNATRLTRALFSQIPYYNIVVEKATVKEKANGRGRKNERGNYDIYVTNSETKQKYLINIGDKAAKILYVWFLLHPRKEISEKDLQNDIKEIIDLGKHIYSNTTFSEYGGIADNDLDKIGKKYESDLLYKYFKKAPAQLNDSVLQTLDKTDFPDDENWYLIMKDKETYSLSLFAECITIPDELRKVATE